MTPEEFRVLVQRALLNERKTSDVAFEPIDGGVEKVYFWDGGVRASFLLDPGKIKDAQQLALVVKAHADKAHEVAKAEADAATEEQGNGST